jgi:DNA-binding NarL/FixJ family response regulator
LTASIVQVLVAENDDLWRELIQAVLQEHGGLRVIAEVPDELAAVRKAQELQPDLIVLDIELPTPGGIEFARQMRDLSPQSKILFVSHVPFADVVQEALRIGNGYVVKTDVGHELLMAVSAVLRGEKFVSSGCPESGDPAKGASGHTAVAVRPERRVEIPRHHEVGFYSSSGNFLDHVTAFIGTALTGGSAAITVATERHRKSLLTRLLACGLDVDDATKQGRYVAVDVADALAMFVVNRMPDPVRFMQAFGKVIVTAAAAACAEHPYVAIFGEGVHLLWAEGNTEAAIKTEELCNQLAAKYDVDILCGYSLDEVQNGMNDHVFQRICAEHSAVYSR